MGPFQQRSLNAVAEQRAKGQIYAGSSGIVAGLLALSWEGSGLGIALIASWNALRILRKCFNRHHLLTYNTWYVCFMPIALLFTHAYRDWTKPYVFLAVWVPSFVWFYSLISLILRQQTPWIQGLTLNHRLPKGVVSFGLSIVTFGLILAFFASVKSRSVVEISGALLDHFLSPLGRSRLMRTIPELYTLNGFRWVQQYSGVLIAAIGGSVLLAYRFFAKEPVRLSMAVVGFEITLCGTLLSLFPAVARWSEEIYLIAILVGGFLLIFSYLFINKQEVNPIPSSHDNVLLVLLWFLISLFVTRGAERYGFFLDPVLMVLCSYLLLNAFENLTENIKRCGLGLLVISEIYAGSKAGLWGEFPRWGLFILGVFGMFCVGYLFYSLNRRYFPFIIRAAYLGVLFALVIFISSDMFHRGFVRSSVETVRRLTPRLPRLFDGFAQIGNQTPNGSVIAASWDYGSPLNWYAKCATVVDEDHYIPYWIHLLSRHVFSALSPLEALEFLRTHNATYLMMTTQDLFRLFLFTYTGSDAKSDRLASVLPLNAVATNNSSMEIEVTDFIPNSPFMTADALELDNKRYSPGDWHIEKVSITRYKASNRWHVVIYGSAKGKRFSGNPKEFRFGASVLRDEKGIPGSVVMLPNPSQNLFQVLYLSEKAGKLLSVRLYLFGEKIEGFTFVYDTNQDMRCDVDGLRLWKIDYPPHVQAQEHYLARDFPTADGLKKSWQSGDLHFSTQSNP